MSAIQFTCIHCGKRLQVDATKIGVQVQCVGCGSALVVPAPASSQAASPISAQPADVAGGPPVPAALSDAPPPPAPSPPPELSPARETPTKRLFDRISAEVAKVYVGQDELVLGTLVALFSSGHVLIESVPGLGKTLFVRTLGRVLGCDFGRIQFTADLMPSDITGAPIFDMKTQEFRFRPGPGLHAVAAGRRNQSLARQDPRRAAGDHAGIPRHRRRDRAMKSNAPFWCWPHRIRSNRKAPTICPKPSWIVSCSN